MENITSRDPRSDCQRMENTYENNTQSYLGLTHQSLSTAPVINDAKYIATLAKKHFDDQFTGKYSDSGYDTLRPGTQIIKDEKSEDDKEFMTNLTENKLYNDSTKLRKPHSKTDRRPETWNAEKFDCQWNKCEDTKVKVDESKVVKEFSYEYITGENNDASEYIDQANTHECIQGQTVGLSLESPKIVRETQEATQRTLVQDRIKAFSLLKKNHSSDNNFRRKSLDPKVLAHAAYERDEQESSLNSSLHLITPRNYCSEALVAPIKAEFAVTKSSVIKAHEAQVKSVHNYKKNDSLMSNMSDPKSPQDIINSRLSKINLRKFLFDEESLSSRLPVENILLSKVVKDKPLDTRHFLKNCDEKQDSRVYQSETELSNSRRRFHSDSDLLSDDYSENCVDRINCRESNYNSSTIEKVDNAPNENQDVMIPPRPPKKPLLGGDMSRRMSSSNHNLVESVDELMKNSHGRYNYVENNPWGEHDGNQLYANNPLLYPTIQSSAIVPPNIGMPPEERAPLPPPHSNSVIDDQMSFLLEENYLPMSPPKKHINGMMLPASSNSSLSSKHQTTPEPSTLSLMAELGEIEEHTYIEMNGDSSKRTPRPILAPPIGNIVNTQRIDLSKIAVEQSAESPRYYEIDESEETQHYEYIYRAASHYESIYMEVPGGEVTPNIDERPVVPKKPFDLKHKSPSSKSLQSIQNNFSYSLKKNSDTNCDLSSDADDEASKDFESIDPPKNKRFSLSDTFRPASYYLNGAEPSSDPDAHDSSDSDLVSPPPIPTSPPPLDELDNDTKSMAFDYDNLVTPEPPPHLRNALNTSRSLRSNRKCHTDHSNSSQNSMTKDKNYSSSLHSEKYKRRPVFEESMESMQNEDSFVLGSEDHYPISAVYPELGILTPIQRDRSNSRSSHDIKLSRDKTVPQYSSKSSLDHNGSFHLENSYSFNRNDLQHSMHPSLNASLASSVSSSLHLLNTRSSSSLKIPEDCISQNVLESTNKLQEMNNRYSSEATYQNLPAPKLYTGQVNVGSVNVSNGKQDDLWSSNSNIGLNHQRTASDISNRSLKSPASSSSLCNSGNVHIRGNSNVSITSETSPRSAPYYYSDVIRDKPEIENSMGTPRTRAYQLNNQRDLEASKRQDIGRKVNLISPSLYDHRKFASQLQASAHIFEKNGGTPDERNVYEADTLRRKFDKRARTPNFEVDSRNVYPYGISLKSDSHSTNASAHRRTRSLEGLMDDSDRAPTHSVAGELPNSDIIPTAVQEISPSVSSHIPSHYHLSRENRVTSSSTHQSLNSQVPHNLNVSVASSSFQAENSLTPLYGNINSHRSDGRVGNLNDLCTNDSVGQENWDDDSEWRDQLRRASLRHTRSLETLDDPKRTNSVESKSPAHQGSNNLHDNENSSARGRSPANALDEYRVDYREGLINPVGAPNETFEPLERTRHGLTCLEGYEWDSTEEKFMKPHMSDSNIPTELDEGNQTFLDEGLLAPLTDPFVDNEEVKAVDQTCTLTSNNQMSVPNLPFHKTMDGSKEDNLINSSQRGDGRPAEGCTNEAPPKIENFASNDIVPATQLNDNEATVQQSTTMFPTESALISQTNSG